MSSAWSGWKDYSNSRPDISKTKVKANRIPVQDYVVCQACQPARCSWVYERNRTKQPLCRFCSAPWPASSRSQARWPKGTAAISNKANGYDDATDKLTKEQLHPDSPQSLMFWVNDGHPCLRKLCLQHSKHEQLTLVFWKAFQDLKKEGKTSSHEQVLAAMETKAAEQQMLDGSALTTDQAVSKAQRALTTTKQKAKTAKGKLEKSSQAVIAAQTQLDLARKTQETHQEALDGFFAQQSKLEKELLELLSAKTGDASSSSHGQPSASKDVPVEFTDDFLKDLQAPPSDEEEDTPVKKEQREACIDELRQAMAERRAAMQAAIEEFRLRKQQAITAMASPSSKRRKADASAAAATAAAAKAAHVQAAQAKASLATGEGDDKQKETEMQVDDEESITAKGSGSENKDHKDNNKDKNDKNEEAAGSDAFSSLLEKVGEVAASKAATASA